MGGQVQEGSPLGVSDDIGDQLKDFFARAAASLQKAFTGKGRFIDIPLEQLRPTQIAVGMRQVAEKQDKLQRLAKKPERLKEFLKDRPVRVVLGPGKKAYIIDRHHLGLALVLEGYKSAPVIVEEDFSRMSEENFWKKMEEKKYVHPYDSDGKKQPLSEIPETLEDLEDDPYRALAGFARNEGAFIKSMTPFAEFEWADYFRSRISRKLVENDFDKALKQAHKLARSDDAKDLPGYIPPKGKSGLTPKSP